MIKTWLWIFLLVGSMVLFGWCIVERLDWWRTILCMIFFLFVCAMKAGVDRKVTDD